MAAHQTTRLTHHKLSFQRETATYYNTYAVEYTIFSAVPPPQRALLTHFSCLACFQNKLEFWAGGRWRAMQHFGRNHTIQEVYFFSLANRTKQCYFQQKLSVQFLRLIHVFVQHSKRVKCVHVCVCAHLGLITTMFCFCPCQDN